MAAICRACLTAESSLQPIDDKFVNGYNTLTNILVKASDGLPQFSCTSCLENVNNFLLFRDKCIESENKLKLALSVFDYKYKVLNLDIKFTKGSFDSKERILKDELVNNFDIKEEWQVKDEIPVEIQSCFDDNDDSNSQVQGDTDITQHYLEYEQGKKDIAIKKEQLTQNTSKKNSKKKNKKVPVVRLKPEDNADLCCGMCPKLFDDRIKLNEHIETHKSNKECEMCREKFNEWPSLLAHRITHIKKFKDKMCHYCETLFKSVYKLELHYRSSHYDGENKMLPCKYCTRSFPTVKKLLQHISASHVNLKTFQCDHCKKFIASKHGLISHLRKHSEDRPFKCDLCDYSCKYTGGIKAHKMRKHSATKAVGCKTCGRDFASMELLNKHNCNSRATMCPICGVIKSKQLTVHMATHHLGVLFKCELCPAEFKSKSALKVHTRKHSGNRPYSCEFCPMKFFVSAVLKKHRRIHTGEKPFVCRVCQRGFTGKHNLKVHMKVHGEDLIIKRVKNTTTEEEDTRSGLFYATK